MKRNSVEIAGLRLVLVVLTILIWGASLAEAQVVSYTRQFGSIYMDSASGVAANSSGVYVAGVWGDGFDPFLRKYDASGNLVWERKPAAPTPSSAYGVAAGSSGVYIVGYIDLGGAFPGQTSAGGRDAFVIKYDTGGTLLWTRQFGTSTFDEAYGVAVDDTGVYVIGNTQGAFPGHTNSGMTDVFVRKYDTSGNPLWTRQFGTLGNDMGRGIAAEATGIYVVGRTLDPLPGQTLAGAYVRKYSVEGEVIWTRQLGNATAYGASAGATGVYVAGTGTLPGQPNAGGGDVFVQRYDGDGNVVWTRQFGGTDYDVAFGVVADATGVYVGGQTRGTLPGQSSAGGIDAFVARYDTEGAEVWIYQFGTSASDFVMGAMGANAEGIYAAGVTGGALPGQTSAGASDAFLLKFAKTAQETIQALESDVSKLEFPTGPLNQGQTSSLLSKLDNALALVNAGRTVPGCNLLSAFINQVADYVANGLLTAAQGANLTATAQQTKLLVPCRE